MDARSFCYGSAIPGGRPGCTLPRGLHVRTAIVSTFPPRACGIGTFSANLRATLTGTGTVTAADLVAVVHEPSSPQRRGLLATMGLFDLVGTTFSGWLTDRWDSRRLLFAYYGLRGLSLIFLPQALTAGSGLLVFAVFYGLDWIATVPPTVRLATEAFGKDQGPIVFGWVVAAHQVGAAVAALGAGLIRTSLGDYQLAFMISGGLCLIAALLALAVGRVRFAWSAAVP